jgi:hypothetical protein
MQLPYRTHQNLCVAYLLNASRIACSNMPARLGVVPSCVYYLNTTRNPICDLKVSRNILEVF